MREQFQRMMAKLDRRNIVGWAPEMRAGRPAYLYLLKAVQGGFLTQNQLINALHALYQLRFHGDYEELIKLFLKMIRDDRIKVRSQAVKMVIAVAVLHKIEKRPGEPLNIQNISLERILSGNCENRVTI
jgi:hypothetical protein